MSEKMELKTYECGCGGLDNIHLLGRSKCYREWVSEKNSPIELSNDRWLLDGVVITGCTLREQRGYYRHSNGVWSMPKDHESKNSLEDA